jgi:hypothetical protein
MGEATSEAVRGNARVVGVLLQCLSLVTLIATFIVAIAIAQQGQQLLGLTATHDPAPWIVLAAGVIASLMFAGLGYALGMLCAIYDRQVMTEPSRGALGSVATTAPAREWRAAPEREVTRDAHSSIPATSTEEANAAPTVPHISVPRTPQGGLWKALTKERHIRKQ